MSTEEGKRIDNLCFFLVCLSLRNWPESCTCVSAAMAAFLRAEIIVEVQTGWENVLVSGVCLGFAMFAICADRLLY